MSAEKYILTVKQMHFGYVRETFGMGAVIVYDPTSRDMTVEGRKFTDGRDLELLKRWCSKFPALPPPIVPFTDDAYQAILNKKAGFSPKVSKTAPPPAIKVVTSDEDLHKDIDISDTQVSRLNREAREVERSKPKDNSLPVIKGDETVAERVARFQSPEGRKDIPIVHDDSLGVEGGSVYDARNAGQVKSPSPEKEVAVRAAAEARKSEAIAKRKAADISEDVMLAAQVGADVLSVPTVPDSRDTEIAELKSQIAQLTLSVSDPKKAGRPVGARDSKPRTRRSKTELSQATA